ncbi:MAG TPA: tRNA (adenosine(37)-N6)-threonylcarbamoyltransferase complex dimerization subunit type 1 TsaB [Verrucomicrobiae bacterium]
MKILAFEFSSNHRSVAAVEGEAATGFRFLAEAVEATTRHTPAFRLADDVLVKSGWQKGDVNCMAVCLGPGSYTGIRMSLAIAQGWQIMTGGKVCGIDTPSCLAEQIWRGGERGTIVLAIDAMRGEFYAAEFQLGEAGWKQLNDLRITTKEELEAYQSAGKKVLGPDLQKAFPSAIPLYANAAIVAELAVNRGEFKPANELEPIYLREVSFVKSPPTRK